MAAKNKKNTAINKILPSVAQNLDSVAGYGDGRETTGRERQRGGVENTRIWLNLPWSAVLVVVDYCVICQLPKILERVKKQR